MTGRIGVLFIQTQAGFGADSAVHADLMKWLDRDRFDVHVACTSGDGASEPESLGRLRAIPNVHVRPTRFAPSFADRSLRSALLGVRAPLELASLAAYARKHRIRIVHGSDRPRDAGYAVAVARLAGARSVVHVHVKWSSEYGRLATWAVEHADAVFGISRYVTDTVVACGRPRDSVYTIHNAIDPGRWQPQISGAAVRRELGVPEGALVVASVSRLFHWKGQRELLRAIAEVRRARPETYCWIVGADETRVDGSSFTAELRELARELGIAEHVVFTGKRSDVPEIMAACDVFALPSFEEPFGLVFLEAMAMERPVVAVANGGTPEVVEHEHSGLLSPPWDVGALASNLLRLLEDRELRARLGRQGRARYLEQFTPDRMARDAAAAYRDLLGRRT